MKERCYQLEIVMQVGEVATGTGTAVPLPLAVKTTKYADEHCFTRVVAVYCSLQERQASSAN